MAQGLRLSALPAPWLHDFVREHLVADEKALHALLAVDQATCAAVLPMLQGVAQMKIHVRVWNRSLCCCPQEAKNAYCLVHWHAAGRRRAAAHPQPPGVYPGRNPGRELSPTARSPHSHQSGLLTRTAILSHRITPAVAHACAPHTWTAPAIRTATFTRL